MERLDKFLSGQNRGSRKEIAQMVRRGLVRVNGIPAESGDQKLDPDVDRVTVDGEEIRYRKHLYLMMNKPAGVLSATEDSRTQTVLDLLPPELSRRGLFPAGRLDKDATGLLLITDDGDFAHRMLAPKNHVYKLYRVKPRRPITEADIAAFEGGVWEGGRHFAPARLRQEEQNGEAFALVEIREGKFHQVKRMFRAVGNEVLELKRLRIGGLWLDETLPPGGVRELTPEEAAAVFH